MDAASKFKSLVIALIACLGTTSFARCDEGETSVKCEGICCRASTTDLCDPAPCQPLASQVGLAALVSDWLAKSPKFSAELAIHFGSTVDQPNKLGANAPSVEVTNATHAKTGQGALELVPHITMPMKFMQRIPRIQIGEFVGDVIACGHRICSGNKCYDVKDEPVSGTHCDNNGEHAVTEPNSDNEPILVLPIAPPVPPGQEIAYSIKQDETEVESFLRNSGLNQVQVTVPVATIVDLLVTKTELSTRLEMTEQIMSERQSATEQFQLMAERNARLSTQLAVAEARQQASDALTAGFVERVELAVKLASIESKTFKVQDSNYVAQSIQEDLSNIRRQIAILRRSHPVPFAPSYVGVPMPRPYVPTAQLPFGYNDLYDGQVIDSDETHIGLNNNEPDCGKEKTQK